MTSGVAAHVALASGVLWLFDVHEVGGLLIGMPVLLWWTADEIDGDRAYRVAYNGYVTRMNKNVGAGYLACGCVRAS